MKMEINKIPSIFKNITFQKSVYLSDNINSNEGTIVMVEALNHEGKYNILDFVGGRLGKLWHWDKIPAVLGYRKATTEFAGFVPKKITPCDELYLLCESGIVGEISGVFEAWGRPMKVKVLGSILDEKGNSMNLKNYKLPKAKGLSHKSPLIIFLSTRMDCGKTTIACKIGHEISALGKKVAGAKLTGVAFSQDLLKLMDAGVSPVYDFVDMGLPSTCNGNSKEVVNASLNIINKINSAKPDCILTEFGDAVLGEYHVADILQNKQFQTNIKMVVLAANDFVGIKGTTDILYSWGIKVDLVTGPIANSKVGVNLIKKYFNLTAESNQHNISKTLEIVREKIC